MRFAFTSGIESILDAYGFAIAKRYKAEFRVPEALQCFMRVLKIEESIEVVDNISRLNADAIVDARSLDDIDQIASVSRANEFDVPQGAFLVGGIGFRAGRQLLGYQSASDDFLT